MSHSARFGSYSLMELEMNKLISVQLVQSNGTQSSYQMELEGLKRCREDLKEFTVKALITDRHTIVLSIILPRKCINFHTVVFRAGYFEQHCTIMKMLVTQKLSPRQEKISTILCSPSPKRVVTQSRKYWWIQLIVMWMIASKT
ncbi:uncharacterized protein LOC141901573 [Tubulanus polymorphus]|uniref:uncharacterized protein LOC141901573 n=1 Tax=Tubulanus polymorphus TaxID=672921 RepID=UPI003DA42D09